MFTQEYLNSILHYDPYSGFLWSKDGIDVEDFNDRYIRVWIDGVRYYSHRIIWIMIHGYSPVGIDHVDGNRANNKLDNLREATQSQNLGNADLGPNRGIEKHGRKHRVRISGTGWKIELGSYDTIEEAREAYRVGAIKYFGEFAYSERP